MGAKKEIIAPVKMAKKIERDYPEVWKQMDYFHSLRNTDEDMKWPSWCWAPMAAAIAVVREQHGISPYAADLDTMPYLEDVYAISALAPWRHDKQIFVVDPGLAKELQDSEEPDKIPTELLHHLPYYSFYTQVPGLDVLGKSIDGFFTSLEFDVKNEEHELRFLTVSKDMQTLSGFALHITEDTVGKAFDRYRAISNERAAESLGHDIFREVTKKGLQAQEMYLRASELVCRKLLPIVIYICSADSDIRPHGKASVAKRYGDRISQPIQRWEVGYRIGPALSRYHSEHDGKGGTHDGSHSPKRPHVRRAHWSHYWVGPRYDRRLIAKWIPPIYVNADSDDENTATIHRVKK